MIASSRPLEPIRGRLVSVGDNDVADALAKLEEANILRCLGRPNAKADIPARGTPERAEQMHSAAVVNVPGQSRSQVVP